jgi:CubicO group peptidase (beta-lactamase class C family)
MHQSKRSFLFACLLGFIFFNFSVVALPQKDHPLQSKATSTVNLSNWQQYRGYGLRNFEKLAPNVMGVNAEHIRQLVLKPNYAIGELPAVKALVSHKALDAIVILRGNKIIYEHYANAMTAQSLHSCQSSTKTMLNLLVGYAVKSGKLNLNDKVEKYVPNIGSGFKGQTVANVLNMNVKHELDEVAAYTGSGKVRALLDRDESSSGWLPSKITPLSNKQHLAELKGGNADGSNLNRTDKYFYASANTGVGTWIVEKATGVPSEDAVRNILHAIGGENTVYMVTDKTGWPIVMGGMIATARDFARFGILLMNGGEGANGQLVGGGQKFVKATLENGQVSIGPKGWYYTNSTYVSPYGFGHAGWGGQWLWTDPQSKTVIAVFSGLNGDNPAEPSYAKMLMNLAKEVVEYNRKK